MNYAFDKHYAVAFEQQKILTAGLSDLQKKMDDLDEDFYIDKKVPTETYDRLRAKLVEEKMESSNLKQYYSSALQLSTKLATVWTLGETSVKEKLQKMIFPDGISYNHEKGTFLTEKGNEVFAPIAALNSVSGNDKQKQDGIKAILSNQVGRTGFESPLYYCNFQSLVKSVLSVLTEILTDSVIKSLSNLLLFHNKKLPV